MGLRLNPAETDALVRNLDGLTELYGSGFSVELTRRDSLDNEHENGFLIVRVALANGTWWEDAFSDTGSTNSWAASE